MTLNQRPIPEPALRDKDAVELLRVWLAENGLHCSLKVGMYRETTKIPEEAAWGTILADVARHVANALQSKYAVDPADAVSRIRDSFLEELAAPTSEAKGNFVDRH